MESRPDVGRRHKQESAMINHSSCKSILALIAVAALGSVLAMTDASARGFGGGGMGRSFSGGGQLGGNSIRQASAPSGATRQPIHSGATIQAAAKPVPVPPGGTNSQKPPTLPKAPAVPEIPEIGPPNAPIHIHLPPGGLPSL